MLRLNWEVLTRKKMLVNNNKLLNFLLFGLFAVSAFNCSTDKRLQKAELFLVKKGKLPQVCAERFPLKDTIIYKDSVKLDTIYQGIHTIDTVFDKDTMKVFITLPAKTINKEVVKYRYIYRENTAKVSDFEKKLSVCSSQSANKDLEIAKLRAELNEWQAVAKQRWWFLWILIFLAIAITLRRPVMGLVKKLM